MIRLVACDLDGTLLYPDGQLPAGIFDVIRRLREKGVRFAAASGRQYDNLYRLFAPEAEHMDFLCENGAVIVAGGKQTASFFPRPMADEIIRDIEGAGMLLLLSTPAFSVLRLDAPRTYADDILYRLQNAVALAADPALYAGQCVKLSGFREEGWILRSPTRATASRRFPGRWGSPCPTSPPSGTSSTTKPCWTPWAAPTSWPTPPRRCWARAIRSAAG